MSKIKPASADWRRASKVNWLLYIVRGFRICLSSASSQVRDESYAIMPVHENIELSQISAQVTIVQQGLEELDRLIVQHNLNKVSRRLDTLKKDTQ